MPAPRSHRRARLAALVSVVLAVTGFQFFLAPTAQATPAGDNVVISEVYGGGGNSGATYTHDFIELYNPTGSAISLTGWSVQYRSAAGTAASVTNLTRQHRRGWRTTWSRRPREPERAWRCRPPTPPERSRWRGAAGVVFLANNTTPVNTVQGDFANAAVRPANVIDTVGYGTTSTTYETTNTAVNLTSATSAQRAANGADSNQNNPDFTEATPTPTAAGPAALSLANPGPQTGTVGQPITRLHRHRDRRHLALHVQRPRHHAAPGDLDRRLTVRSRARPSTAGQLPRVHHGHRLGQPTPATDTETFTLTVDAAPAGVTPDQGHPGHRHRLADRRPDRDHRGRGHRDLPDRRHQRLLHPDRRARTPPERLRRDLRLAAQRLHDLPGHRRLRRGHRHRRPSSRLHPS